MTAQAVAAGLVAIAAFALSYSLTSVTLRYAVRRALIDQPGERRSHSQPTPRGGGLGPVLCCLADLLLVTMLVPGERALASAVAAALAAVAAIGWLDDHRPLPIWPRLATHGVAATLVVVLAGGLPGTPIDGFMAALALIFLVGLINLWNFMDGIDGLAASQAALVAAATSLALCIAGEPVWALLSLVVATAVGGFLPFNLPRARIFLGDVGSGSLGLLVGTLLLIAVERGALGVVGAVVLVSAFLLDGGLTLAYRMLRGQRWWQPHREHLYQWAVRAGLSHVRVTRAYAYWTLGVAALIGAASTGRSDYGPLIAGTLAVVGAATWLVVRRKFQSIAREGKET